MQEMTNMKVTIFLGIGQMANLIEGKNLQGEMEPLMMKKGKVILTVVFKICLIQTPALSRRREINNKKILNTFNIFYGESFML